MQELIAELKKELKGEVRNDPATLRVYSVDASIYEVEPLCVVTPRTREDVIAAVRLAGEFEVPIVPRGAATGITGGCLGNGIVLDLSKYLNRVLEIDWENELVVCEPGVVQDRLNAILGERGYRLGPDTSTGNRATLGGMLANNAAGARSLKYGRMVDAVLGVELVLDSSEAVRFEEVDLRKWNAKCTSKGREGEIYKVVRHIREQYPEEIRNGFPKIPRRVSGYNLDELIHPEGVNLSKVVVGSEGSLGVVTEMTLRIVPVPKHTGLCIVHFHDMIEGMRSIRSMLAWKPISVEMIDRNILEMGKLSPDVKDKLDWLEGDPEAVFVLEMEAETTRELVDKLAALKGGLEQKKIGYTRTILTDVEKQAHIWQVRKAGLGLLMSKRSYSRAVAFIEDISVHPEKLADFMAAFLSYMDTVGKHAGIYGHVGSGCMHIRPYIDMRKGSEVALMETILRDVTDMLIEHGGTLSGEHGDGIVRSWLNPVLFGEKLYKAFEELKGVFDPENRMNPGKIVHPEPFDENRRLDPSTPLAEIETVQDFSREGGFALSADLCNGNAQCRKAEGTMCPSFQATGDEYDSTRARAQMLRAITNGNMSREELTGERLKNVLDLCIACKGCKKECPSQVDMAKMKAEVLFHYQEKHGYALRDRLFAFVGTLNERAWRFAGLANAANRNSVARRALSVLGITPNRMLPQFGKIRFSEWARKREGRASSEKRVVLLSDTFTEFNCPEVGMAATHVLEAMGYEVIVPAWQCCGRTLISKGFLRQAKHYATHLTTTLLSFARQGIPIIGLEPSCILTVKDDFLALLGYDNPAMQKILPHIFTFDTFIASEMDRNGGHVLKQGPERVLLHGHCHQKALTGTADSMKVLRAISTNAEEIPTGCCGMAGSFGYEKEHYDFSVRIAELKLVPALCEAPEDAFVVANGFSCRHQIQHLTDHHPLHLAEYLYRSKAFE